MLIETERLFLREMDRNDFGALYRILADPDTMRYYPRAFDEEGVIGWIEKNMNRYRENGFGLWAVCLKDTGVLIGDCGLTLQDIRGEILPEIGYHIHSGFRRRGYAKEAAKAVCGWAFRNTDYQALYSYCKSANEPSIRTAEAIGMRFACEYPDQANGTKHVSVIRREDWLSELTENMIRWAEGRTGSAEYAGRCLSFAEDALEKSSGIGIFGGDSAKESCEMYRDALQSGIPDRGAFVFFDCLCMSGDGPVNRGHCGIGLGNGIVIHAWDTVRIDDCMRIEKLTTPRGDHPRYVGWVPLDRVLRQKPLP